MSLINTSCEPNKHLKLSSCLTTNIHKFHYKDKLLNSIWGQIDTAYWENHKQRINTLLGDSAVYFNVNTGGACNCHCHLKVKMQFLYNPFPCNKKFTY